MTAYSSAENNNSLKLSGIFSLILTTPLYFSYFIFFSPYIIKLLSFLSPLLLSTSLLFLSLITTFIPLGSIINSKHGSFLVACNTLFQKLGFDDDKGENFEDFEVYKIIFGTPMIEATEENPEVRIIFEDNPVGFLEEKAGDHCGNLNMEHGTGDEKRGNVKGEAENYESVMNIKAKDGSFGSMRKEKEWKGTLACILFEERHNEGYNGNNNDEGMDFLWETHETKSNRGKTEEENTKKGRMRQKNEGFTVLDDDTTPKCIPCSRNLNKFKYNSLTLTDSMMSINDDEEDNYVDEEDNEEDDNGKLCCLQALKLSGRKMNLGMGKPNLIKISKAFKGIGWLHGHAKRHGRKGYP